MPYIKNLSLILQTNVYLYLRKIIDHYKILCGFANFQTNA